MGRKRVVKTYKDTSASGDRTPIEGNRYFVLVELVSIKAEEEADSMGRTSEFYIKCGGRGALNIANRTPNEGTINLDLNEVFIPNERLTLYSQFIDKKGGGVVEIPFSVHDQDVGKDDTLIDTRLSVTLGQNRDYLSFLEKGAKVKIAVSANQTRY